MFKNPDVVMHKLFAEWVEYNKNGGKLTWTEWKAGA
jgi:hypothetical protein